MKKILNKWNKFLMLESLSDYDVGGTTRLYHFSGADSPSLHLDPGYFITKRQHYSRNDYNVSDVPRIFFYLNLKHAESQVVQGSTLYTAEVPTTQIYDLSADPLGLKHKSISMGRVTPDYDKILRSLANKPRESKYGPPSPSLLGASDSKYSGVYYKSGDMEIVIWLDTIKVTKNEQSGGSHENK